MPFSFLNPLFWLGALAVAAPIWLHLRRKRETNIVRFSALRFLEDQPEPRRSPARLQNLVLLALRMLALLLVVAAFAWPYLRGADTATVKESRVYILDNTMSHQAGNGFTRDRDRILGELGKADTSIQMAVIELASTPRIIALFGDDRATARQRLQQLQPSFQRGSYLAAFRQAGTLLANSLGEHKRIVLLGDNQQNQWNENVNTPPFLRDVQIDLPRTAAPMLPNLSLSEPRAQRIFLGGRSLVNFTAKLSHAGEAASANVVLKANDQVIFNRSIDLKQQPQTILLQAQWELDSAAWLKGEVALEAAPDALAADDHAFFSLPPVQEGTVAVLAQSQYLRLALSPEIMRGQWAARVLEPAAMGAEVAAGKDADVLCLESNYLQSGDARKLLWRYLTNGRGVLLLVNRVTPAIKGYLRELGFEAEDTVEAIQPERFQFVSFNHAIFHPFLSPDYGNLMEIKVSKYVPLKAAQAMPLVFTEKGAGLFFQGTKFPGRLFVAAFGLDREHTSWPVHQSFVPFLDLVLQAARAEDPTPTTFEPGEVTQLQLPATAPAREVVLKDDHREWSRAAIDQGRAQLRMPDTPGLYSLAYEGESKIERMFSVNPSPKESELVYSASPEALNAWRLDAGAGNRAAALVSHPKIGLRGILQQRLWWWMVLAGIIFLMAEMALSERRTKHS